MSLFQTGNSEPADKSVVCLELPNVAWFKAAFIKAISDMAYDENWTLQGDATIPFARDKAGEMLESVEFDVIIPFLPVGSTMLWHTNAPPTRWLLCTGGAVLKSEYAELYAILGDKYGATETQFGLPDMQDVSPMGVGSNVVGLDDYAGEIIHTLSTNEMPIHAHTILLRGNGVNGGALNRVVAPAQTGTLASNVVTDVQGGGNAHNNVHPVFGVNFIIYGGKT